ncbi:pantoate--beta-alanine ligase [Chitinophaga pendula]|uniref:pantoate--beta-alanine ligase n=1 Tax=Chitinophaga TaxID=79328 RepID=UPI000BAED882|nr:MULTISPECIES: pantoate--beta-alanine ligase [Chitinophaga]ASZ13177.1 pantoate--beta-alanine ligase [Chitinophaga sp. MD30]UCJ09201.1 pantoate--beta-alanine ligase [Chitinophaga pendula]
MYLFKRKDELMNHLESARKQGSSIGFVPTMGALHQGHLSLINMAKQQCNLVVCSIFVNPTQFNDPADFEKYPITIDQDILQLTAAGTDILFLPAVAEMYPEGLASDIHYDFGSLETVLEGAHRPGHFQGVGRIVHKLLDIVAPDRLFMGQKDLQQCLIVKRLLKLISSPAELVVCPTLREPGGLAMSSRNMRLSPEERELATIIFKVLTFIKENGQQTALAPLLQTGRERLAEAGFRVDYLDVITLEADGKIDFPERLTAGQPSYAVVAAHQQRSQVRLIDNMLVN